MSQVVTMPLQLWQQRMETVSQRDNYIWQEAMWTDCTFSVGQGDKKKLFKCHRVYLAKTSPVFAAMLFGELYVDGEIIYITDISAEAFHAFLIYVYEGRVEVSSFEAGCGLLYSAKKYLLPERLVREVRGVLWRTVYPENAWRAIQFGSSCDEPELLETAWQVVQLKTKDMLDLPDFVTISETTLVTLVREEALSCSEMTLYSGCRLWACEQQKLNPGVTLREILGPVIGHLRFLSMTFKELARGPCNDKILSTEESTALFMAKSATEYVRQVPKTLCKKKNPRDKPDLETFPVIGSIDTLEPSELFPENSVNLFASVECTSSATPTLRLGVRVPTQVKPPGCDSESYDEHFTVLMWDRQTKKLLSETSFKSTVKYEDVIDVPFTEPVKVEDKADLRIKIIFHKSGRYPSKYKSDDGNVGGRIVITGPFGGVQHATLVHYKILTKFVHYYAFSKV